MFAGFIANHWAPASWRRPCPRAFCGGNQANFVHATNSRSAHRRTGQRTTIGRNMDPSRLPRHGMIVGAFDSRKLRDPVSGRSESGHRAWTRLRATRSHRARRGCPVRCLRRLRAEWSRWAMPWGQGVMTAPIDGLANAWTRRRGGLKELWRGGVATLELPWRVMQENSGFELGVSDCGGVLNTWQYRKSWRKKGCVAPGARVGQKT